MSGDKLRPVRILGAVCNDNTGVRNFLTIGKSYDGYLINKRFFCMDDRELPNRFYPDKFRYGEFNRLLSDIAWIDLIRAVGFKFDLDL